MTEQYLQTIISLGHNDEEQNSKRMISSVKWAYGPVPELFVLIACVQKPPLNAHANVSSGTRGLILGLRQHLLPCFVYTSSEGIGVCAHMRKHA